MIGCLSILVLRSLLLQVLLLFLLSKISIRIFMLVHVSASRQLPKEIPEIVSGNSVLLINLSLDIAIGADLVIKHFRGRHHYFPQRLVEGAGTYELLEHVWCIFVHLVLGHFLRVPETNISCRCNRNELVLLVVEFQHGDFLNMCIDLPIMLFRRLVNEVYRAGDSTERQQILLFREVNRTDRSTLSQLLLLAEPIVPYRMIEVHAIVDFDVPRKGGDYEATTILV